MTITVDDHYGATLTISAYLPSDVTVPHAAAQGSAPLGVIWRADAKILATSPWYPEMDHMQMEMFFNGMHYDSGLIPFTPPGGSAPGLFSHGEPETQLLIPGIIYPLTVTWKVYSTVFTVVNLVAQENVIVVTGGLSPPPFWPDFDSKAQPGDTNLRFTRERKS